MHHIIFHLMKTKIEPENHCFEKENLPNLHVSFFGVYKPLIHGVILPAAYSQFTEFLMTHASAPPAPQPESACLYNESRRGIEPADEGGKFRDVFPEKSALPKAKFASKNPWKSVVGKWISFWDGMA